LFLNEKIRQNTCNMQLRWISLSKRKKICWWNKS